MGDAQGVAFPSFGASHMSAWKWLIIGCFAGGAIHAFVPGILHTQPDRSPAATGTARVLPDFADLVDRVGPAVVNVTTRAVPKSSANEQERLLPLLQGPGEDAARSSEHPILGIGSGFVLRDDGYILTNAHVVAGADEVFVRFTGRTRELKADVVGTDVATDIALLKVDARHLPVVRPGSSRTLRVGDWVVAIGSPFGFDNTITAGIVSAKERRLPQGPAMPFLQSDVAINPGSSGGPLVNLAGEVVGINSKIYTRTGGYMGVSFAIPIETAVAVGNQLRLKGLAGL